MEGQLFTLYVAIVFFGPWLVYASLIVRKLTYARKRGIRLFAWDANERIRELRLRDPHARAIHERTGRWLVITAVAWILGFFGLMIVVLVARAGTLN